MSWGSWLRQIVTGPDNETMDVARVCAVASVVVYLGMTIYTGHHDPTSWKPQEWGIGLGSVFGGAGAWLALKNGQEPPPK